MRIFSWIGLFLLSVAMLVLAFDLWFIVLQDGDSLASLRQTAKAIHLDGMENGIIQLLPPGATGYVETFFSWPSVAIFGVPGAIFSALTFRKREGKTELR